MSYRIALLLLIMAVTASPAFALNPKSVERIDMLITQSGTLSVDGTVDQVNISLYVPQEGVQGVSVASSNEMTWRYANDTFGNRLVVMEWGKSSGAISYEIKTTVRNTAKFVNPTADIGYDTKYLNGTKNIIITEDIKKLAYPYEKTWENVAYLAQLVYDTVDYDISLVGQRHSSEWTLENKRGVCVEHANLLAALLRASGIPTRYIVGYAYSSVDKKMIGHTWVEVLGSDGVWVPFDPTWLEGGYLDATHVKTANLLDDTQSDILSYKCALGSDCSILWDRGGNDIYSDKGEILDYVSDNKTSISLEIPSFPRGGFGYVKATVQPDSCLINQINIQSCVSKSNEEVLQIYDKERGFFSCSSRDVYWFFRDTDGKNSYSCPVTVFDQIGSTSTEDAATKLQPFGKQVLITGPDTVAVGETFNLVGSADGEFIFYSPNLGRSRANDWVLKLNRPGVHDFYLYKDGRLATKQVSVVEQIEFEIGVLAPKRVYTGNFTVNVTIKNVGPARTGIVVSQFGTARTQKSIQFNANETKMFQINLTAAEPGDRRITVSVQGNNYQSTTAAIEVASLQAGGILNPIVNWFRDTMAGVRDFFLGLFGKK